MIRRLTVALVLIAALLSVPLAAAQESTSPPPQAPIAGVTLYNPDGSVAATVVVDGIIDPFQEVESGFEAQNGFRYVLASITITAEQPLETTSYGFALVDAEGVVYPSTFALRAASSSEQVPDFPGGQLSAGDVSTGAVLFQIPEEAELAYITYQPTFDLLFTVADFRDEPVREGDEVAYEAADGSASATLSVTDLLAPFEGFDPAYPPDRGYEFTAALVTIENTGTADLTTGTYDFYLVDAQGLRSSSTSAFLSDETEAETPSLPFGVDLAPGDSVTGLVVFETVAGAEPDVVYYSPTFDRQVRLAEYGATQAPAPSGTPAARPVDPSGIDDPGLAVDDPQLSPQCEEAIAWVESALANFSAVGDAFAPIFAGLAAGELDPFVIRDAALTLNVIASAHEAYEVPPLAENANASLVTLLFDTAAALEELAGAVELGDDDALGVAVEDLLNTVLNSGLGTFFLALDALAQSCPEVLAAVESGGAFPVDDSGSFEAFPEPVVSMGATVDLVDIAFEPSTLTAPANAEITLTLTNSGAAVHTFVIDELGVDSGDVAAGETTTVSFNSGEPGTYTYYCRIPGHEAAGMTGTLIVEAE